MYVRGGMLKRTLAVEVTSVNGVHFLGPLPWTEGHTTIKDSIAPLLPEQASSLPNYLFEHLQG